MRNPVVAAVVQLSSQADVARNLERVADRVAEARRRGAEIVVLPENFALMGEEGDKLAVAEDLDAPTPGPVRAALAGIARREGVWLVGGGLPEKSPRPEAPFNTCAVFGPDGELVGRYRKIHLFDADPPGGVRYRESANTSAGDTPVVARAGDLGLGLSVCYDVRFPELYRRLADGGAEAFVVPAAFTLQTGKDHWHVLLRARAVECGVYVLAAAQHGDHPRGRRTYGKSCIVDPWGDVVAQASDGEGIAVAALEPAVIARVRSALPSLSHRRLT